MSRSSRDRPNKLKVVCGGAVPSGFTSSAAVGARRREVGKGLRALLRASTGTVMAMMLLMCGVANAHKMVSSTFRGDFLVGWRLKRFELEVKREWSEMYWTYGSPLHSTTIMLQSEEGRTVSRTGQRSDVKPPQAAAQVVGCLHAGLLQHA